MSTKFKLSIDLFTPDVQDSVDVAQLLRGVADRLAKFASLPWSPYALSGEIRSRVDRRRVVGTWSVEPEVEISLPVYEEASSAQTSTPREEPTS